MQSKLGDSALHFAAQTGNVDLVKSLVIRRDLVDKENHARDTALHIALRADYGFTAKQLVIAGASVRSKNLFGKTPRDIAKERGLSSFIDFE